tara:strand:+ start:19974 stop:21440 length:1467 start_codon:yes stop_codon:yes gene_type:complete
MNIKNKYFSILIVFSLLIFGCSKSDIDIPEDLELNNFIWKGLNAYYLWQSDIPDLQDTRFRNQTELNNYLSGFPEPETLFENLLNRPTDRFSIMVDDYISLENSFKGLNVSSGMEFGLVRYRDTPSNIFGYVRYVVPNSDAAANNVIRGQIFTTVDGQQLTENNAIALLFGNNTSFTIGLAGHNNGNPIANGNTISLVKTELQENPIAIAKVITEGTQRTGYLLYNQFAGNYDGQLNAAFANFQAENINNLIIDLRYNPGGFVRSATYLAGMITGQFTGELFSQQVWNEKATEAWSAEIFRNNFTNEIRNVDSNGTVVLQESINSLGLNKVFFIITNASASASELLINSLSSYIEVRVTGTTTTGKQEGSITLYDSDNYTRTGANLNANHRYAMQPIVFEISNKDGVNYPNGIVPESTAFPGVYLPEDFGNLGVLGERSDPLLDETLTYMNTGRKSIQKSNKVLNLNEFYNSKLAHPSKDNMIVDFKN